MNQTFDLALVALSATVASLTEEASGAFASYKKAKGARVSERRDQSSDHPDNRKWRDREFDFVSSYHALKEKAVLLADPLIKLDAEIEALRQNMIGIRSIDEQRQLVEHSRVQERATQLYLEFELIDVPDPVGGFNAAVSRVLFTGRRFSIRRSIAFLPLSPMVPALPLTYEEAIQQAKNWIAATVTGNAEVIEIATGELVKNDELPAPRLPMSVSDARRFSSQEKDLDKRLYATISLIHHASAVPGGGFDSGPCWKGYKIEIDFVHDHSRKLCRCGANIRLGEGSSGEDHYSGCCSGN